MRDAVAALSWRSASGSIRARSSLALARRSQPGTPSMSLPARAGRRRRRRVDRGGDRAPVRTRGLEVVEPLVLKGKASPFRPSVRSSCWTQCLRSPVASTRPSSGASKSSDLLNRLAASVETRTPQLATIIGPPASKSRLARELLGGRGHVVVGRCLSYGDAITYWPLQEIASQVGDVRAVLATAPDAELVAIRIDAALGVMDTLSPSRRSPGGSPAARDVGVD